MPDLRNKTLFITGGSRGIGKAIAVRAGADGANVVIAAKTTREHESLPGTIYSAAEAVEQAGGHALPFKVDIRDADAVQAAMDQAAKHFGGIDILINNAGAISLTGVEDTSKKRFDLMFDINVRAAYLCSKMCLPWLRQSDNPHILMLSPPLNVAPKWFKKHSAYTLSKYSMTLAALGLAEELRHDGIAVNTLWPRTVIATAAINLLEDVNPENCRLPTIMADAAHALLTRPARKTTGQCFIDEAVLREAGVTSMDSYGVKPGTPLIPDLFLD